MRQLLLIPFLLIGTFLQAQPGFDRSTPFTTLERASFAFGDIDGDGDEDVLIMGSITNDGYYTQLYTYDHPAGYSLVASTPFPGVANGAAAFADIDNDNDLDLLIVGATGEAGPSTPAPAISSFYLNDGNGQFTLDPNNNLPGRTDAEVAFADFDQDNDLDLVLTGYESVTATAFNQEFILYENDGGVFTNANGNNPFSQVGSSFDIGDVNGDTYLDIVVGSERITASPVKIYLNSGGSLTFTEGVSPISLGNAFVKLANIDGDEALELLLTGQTNSNFSSPAVFASLYDNNGAGVFSAIPNDPILDVFLASADFGDLDGDGDPDLIVAGTAYVTDYAGATRYYVNENGSFTQTALTGLVATYRADQVSIVDINQDGDMDYIQAGFNDSGSSRAIYLNTFNGAPAFTGSNTASFEENLSGVALDADANDGDGGETDQSITYSLTGNGADDALFTIQSTTGEVSFKNSPDFESPQDANADNNYVLNISVSDGKTTINSDFTITVTDGDDVPTITSANAATFPENGTGTVYTATATDAESAVTFTLGTGDDNDLFNLDANSGELTFINAPNFESPEDANSDNVYEITITATDISDNTDQINVSITVTDVSEGATAMALDNLTIGSGNSIGDVVGTLTFTSPDAIPQITFELVSGFGDNSSFDINGNKLTAAASFDVNVKSDYSIRVRAFDNIGNELFEDFTITVKTTVFDPNALIVTTNADAGTGSLREAITAAELNPGNDIINISSSVSTISLISALPNITEDVEIKGAGQFTTVIDGGNAVRPFIIMSGTVYIANLTIQNGLGKGGDTYGGGAGAGMGGALYIDNGDITIEKVTFKGNQALGGSSNVGVHDGGDGPLPGLGGAKGETINNFTTGLAGGNGGFGAGGGRGGFGTQGAGRGGNGGYGAGGGGGESDPFGGEPGGSGGAFAGNGGSNGSAGGAGAGLGGAIFVRNGSVYIESSEFDNNESIAGTPGSGGGSAQAKAGAIFNLSAQVSTFMVDYSANSAANAGSSETDNNDKYGAITELSFIVISQQPVDQTGITEGGDATFSVTVTGSVNAYQWEVNDGNGWTIITDGGYYGGANTNELTISCLRSELNGFEYRCVVDGVLSDQTSASASLEVIQAQPITVSISGGTTISCAAGESKIFSADPINVIGSPAYQWLVNDVEVNGETSNELTATVSIGDKVSVTVSDPNICFTRASGTAELTMTAGELALPTVSIQQISPLCSADVDQVDVQAIFTNGGTNPDFVWYLNGNLEGYGESETIYSISLGDIISVSMTSNDPCVGSNNTATAELTLGLSDPSEIEFTQHPQDVTVEFLDNPTITFSVAASGEGLSYQWQYYYAPDDEWIDGLGGLSSSSVQGEGTSTVTITDPRDNINGRKVRCLVGTADGCPAASEEATINMGYGTIAITNTSNDKTVEGSLPWAVEQTIYFRANTTGVILDASGISGTIDLSETLRIRAGVTLKGPGADLLTITSTSGISNILNNTKTWYGEASLLTIEGLTISGGSTYGVRSEDDISLTDVKIDNTGWGLNVTGGAVTLDNVHISNTTYETFSLGCGTCTGIPAIIRNSSFTGGKHGMLMTSRHDLTIENCLFKDNTQDGLFVSFTEGTSIFGSSFINNYNGIRINNGNTTIQRSTFSGNSYMGVYIPDDGYTFDVVVNSSTISNNQYGISQDFGEMLPDVNNSIIVGNTQKDIYGSITSSVGYLAYEKPYNSNSLSGVTENNLVGTVSDFIDPSLTTSGILMYHEPASCSPVIDAGSSDLTTDQLGNPIVGLPDIGAIELQSGLQPLVVSATINQQSTDICPGEPATFTATPINGGDAPSYQWKINGENAGTDSDTFTTSALQEGDEVTVAVTSNSNCQLSANPGESDLLVVSFSGLPGITSHPESQVVSSTGQTSFSVSGVGTALTYQWQVNEGSGWSDIVDGGIYSGATTSTLTISSPGLDESGNEYRAAVIESCPAYSDPATLTVQLEFVVNTLNDVIDANDGVTSLREALTSAQGSVYWVRNGNIGDANPILIDASGLQGSIVLTSKLPDVYSNIIIQGPSDNSLTITTTPEAGSFNFLIVGTQSLEGRATLNHLNFTNSNNHTLRLGGTGQMKLLNSSISGGARAAIIAQVGTVDIYLENSSITGNTETGGFSSAISVTASAGKVVAKNSLFSDNQSSGGVIVVSQADLTLTNCTISGNTNDSFGAIITMDGTKNNKVIHSTIVHNTYGNGYGIKFSTRFPDYAITADQYFEGNIIAGNTGGNIQLQIHDRLEGSYNLLSDQGLHQGSDFGPNVLYNIPVEEIVLPDLTDNGGPTLTHDLAPCSYALDFVTESSQNTPELDARGVSRIGATDAGALEFNGTRDTSGGTPELTVSPSINGLCEPQSVTFTATNDEAYTYSWFVDGQDVSHMENTYTAEVAVGQVVKVTIESSARCLATNTVSAEVTMEAGALPLITEQPQSQSIDVNGSTSFTVAATGNNLTYQWQQQTVSGEWKDLVADQVEDNLSYSGEQTATLTITKAMAIGSHIDPYTFRCVLTDDCSIYSDEAQITFNSYPSGVVTNGSNAGAGSLRQALLDVAYLSGNSENPYIIDATAVTETIHLTENLPVIDDLYVVIQSPSAGLEFENISAINGLRFFELVNGASLTIDNVSFTGGKADQGAAIKAVTSTLNLTNVTMSNNVATGNGGAIYSENSVVSIDGGTFQTNYALNGGLVYAVDGNLSISNSNSVFAYAEQGTGGAIYAAGTSCNLDAVDFNSGNALNVGAIFINNLDNGSSTLNNIGFFQNRGNGPSAIGAAYLIGDVTMYNSFASVNYSNGSGALVLESGAEFYNSTVIGSRSGAALVLKGGNVKLWNLTIVRNNGDVIVVEDGADHSISNSIFDGLVGTIGSEYGHNLYMNPNGGIFDGNTAGNIEVTETEFYQYHMGRSLVNDGDGKYMEMPPCSGAINSGVLIAGSETDQIGQTRVGVTDIGAVEFQGEYLAPGQFTYELVADKPLLVCDDETIDVTFRLEVGPDITSPYVDEYEFEWEVNGDGITIDYSNPEITATGLKAGDMFYAYAYAYGDVCLNDDYAEVMVTVQGQTSPNIYSTPNQEGLLGEVYEYNIQTLGEGVVEVTEGTVLPDWLALTQSEESDAVELVAGSTRGNSDGIGEAAQFGSTFQLAFDQLGNLIVSDRTNQSMRKVTTEGEVSTIVSSLAGGLNYGVTVGPDGLIYFVDRQNYGVSKIDAAGNVEHVIGLGSRNNQEGDQASAGLNWPEDLAFGPDGSLYVTDKNDGYVMKWADGHFSRFASINGARYITVSEDGIIYVSSDYSHEIYKVDQQGVVTGFAGQKSTYGFKDGYGEAARFYYPGGLAMDQNGNLIVGDNYNYAIRMVTPEGYVSTLAGGQEGDAIGSVTDQMFGNIEDVAVHPITGDIFIADSDHSKIKMLSLAPSFTLSGTPDALGTFDISLTASGDACYNETQTFSISVTESDPPVFLTENNISYDENETILDIVVQDASPIALSITGGEDASFFEVQSGGVAFVNAPNFETPLDTDMDNVYELEITATDAGNIASTKLFYVAVMDANDAPTDISLDNASVDENKLAGAVVGSLATTDEDASEVFTYSMVEGISDNSFFDVVEQQLVTRKTIDFDVKSTYQITVKSTDLGGLSIEKQFTITINDVTNSAPEFSYSPSVMPAAESEPFIFKPFVVDLESDDLTLSVSELPEWLTFESTPNTFSPFYFFPGEIVIDRNNSYYGITANNMLFSNFGAEPDMLFNDGDISNPFEGGDVAVAPNGDLYLTSSGSIMKYDGASLTVFYTSTGVRRVEYHPDGYIVFTEQVSENTYALKKISLAGTESTILPDMSSYGSILTVRGNGDIVFPNTTNDLRAYTITGDPGQGILTESIPKWDENITSTGEIALYYYIDIAFDQNDDLYILFGNSVEEGLTDVLLKATGQGNEIIWQSDEAYEAICIEVDANNNPNLVTNEGILIYEENAYVLSGTPTSNDIGNHLVTLSVSDGVASTDKTITIEVDYINDAPTGLEISATSILENNPLETDLLTFTTVDPDSDYDSFTYELVTGEGDADNGEFQINGDGLQALKSFDAELELSKSIRVRTTDAQGETFEGSFEITINDINDAPSDILLSNTSVNEGLLPGAVVGQLTSVDEDSEAPFTYSLVDGSNDNQLFEIINDELVTKVVLDYSVTVTANIRVSATDDQGATFEKDFTININEVINSAPQLVNSPELTATEDELYSFNPEFFDFEGSSVSITATLPGWLTEQAVGPAVSDVLAPNSAEDIFVDSEGNVYTLISENYSTVNIEKYDPETELVTTLLDQNVSSLAFADIDAQGNIYYAENTTYGYYPLYQLGNGTPIYNAAGDILAGGYHNNGFIVFVETQSDNTYDIKKVSLDGQAVSTLKEDVGYVAIFDIGLNGHIYYSGSTVVSAIDIDGNTVGGITLDMPTSNPDGPYLYYITDVAVYDDAQAFVMYGEANGANITDVLVRVTPGGEEELWRGSRIYEAGKIASMKPSQVYFLRDPLDSDGSEGTDLSSKGISVYKSGYTNYEGTPTNADVSIHPVSFTLSDGELTNTYNFSLEVVNVNDAPTDITMDNASVDEEVAIGTFIGNISTADEDAGDTHTYEVLTQLPHDGSMYAPVTITDGKVYTAIPVDYETLSSIDVEFRSTDAGGLSVTKTITFTINDLSIVNPGSEDVDWNNPDSWENGQLPDENTDVSLPADFTVVIDEIQKVRNLHVKKNTKVEITNGGALAIYGEYSGEGEVNQTREITGTSLGGYSIVGSPMTVTPDVSTFPIVVYEYDAIDGFTAKESGSLQPGVGYFLRESFPDGNPLDLALGGRPNTGDITVDVTAVGNGYHLLSNPYTAAISVVDFIEANAALEGTLYLWDDGGANVGSDGTRAGDYLAVNKMGIAGTFNNGGTAGGTGKVGEFDMNIGSLQGFFAQATADGQVTFSQSMQVTTSASNAVFFRIAEEIDPNLPQTVKLTLRNEQYKNTIIVGLSAFATAGHDRGYDSKKFEGNENIAFYSLMEEERYAIQGLPFTSGDTVSAPLGFEITDLGAYEISLEETMNLPENLEVTLIDTWQGHSIDLLDSKTYSFDATSALADGRFVLVFTEKEAILSSPEVKTKELVVYGNEHILNIQYPTDQPEQVKIYALDGRTLYDQVVGFKDNRAQIQPMLMVRTVYVLQVANQKIKFILK